MTHTLILGIDPGLNGALALFDATGRKLSNVWDIPTVTHIKGRKSSRSIDLPKLASLIHPLADRLTCAILECVTAAPGQGAVSMFHFGEGYGMLQGILQAFSVKTHLVRPGVWKPALALSSDKGLSIARANQEFPNQPYFTLKKHDGRAEAALLALYGARHVKKAEIQDLY